MKQCDICDFTANSVGQYAGHRSGHVRRGELQKGLNARVKSDGKCKVCGKQFENGSQMRGHMLKAHIAFEDLGSDRTRKFRLLEERGHVCEVCKNVEWMNKQIPIELDHIDGDPTDNVIENLRLICPNCHAQTDTHAGKNVGRPKCKWRDTKRKNYRI